MIRTNKELDSIVYGDQADDLTGDEKAKLWRTSPKARELYLEGWTIETSPDGSINWVELSYDARKIIARINA